MVFYQCTLSAADARIQQTLINFQNFYYSRIKLLPAISREKTFFPEDSSLEFDRLNSKQT